MNEKIKNLNEILTIIDSIEIEKEKEGLNNSFFQQGVFIKIYNSNLIDADPNDIYKMANYIYATLFKQYTNTDKPTMLAKLFKKRPEKKFISLIKNPEKIISLINDPEGKSKDKVYTQFSTDNRKVMPYVSILLSDCIESILALENSASTQNSPSFTEIHNIIKAVKKGLDAYYEDKEQERLSGEAASEGDDSAGGKGRGRRGRKIEEPE